MLSGLIQACHVGGLFKHDGSISLASKPLSLTRINVKWKVARWKKLVWEESSRKSLGLYREEDAMRFG